MGRNLMRRVRWGNVALVAAACAALAFGSAWAFSATTTATLPADDARPLVREAPTADAEDAGLVAPLARQDEKNDAQPRRPRRARTPKARVRTRTRAPVEPRRRAPKRPVPQATAPPVRVVVPAPRQVVPPRTGGREFGFEGG